MSPGHLWGREETLVPGSTKGMPQREFFLHLLGWREWNRKETLSVYLLPTHLPALLSNQTQIDTGIATLYIYIYTVCFGRIETYSPKSRSELD